MRILVIAPHPFYIDRGTPIDVRLVLRVLCSRLNTQVDLLTYHLGEDIELENLNIIRVSPPLNFKEIRPGFSIKKVLCDIPMFFKAWALARKNRYDFIHAGEEAVFFAMFLKGVYNIPYAYDLDSSIAQQLVEKKPQLGFLKGLFNVLEGQAIQKSMINFPVCNALTDLCEEQGSSKTVTLHDISQLDDSVEYDPDLLSSEIDLKGTVFFIQWEFGILSGY